MVTGIVLGGNILSAPARWRAGGLCAALLCSTAFAAPALAQDDEADAAAQKAQITVTATRLPTNVAAVPAVVSVFDAEKIADELATDIKDLVRFEPGVSVPRSPARFGAASGSTGRAGNSGFTIRGIGGNRTLILVDGVRVPDGFNFGAQDVGRGDYVDLGLVKRVEILRGPASALYGSDGMSGAVSFTLSEPTDFLNDGKTVGGLVRAGYSSDDNEFSETAIIAAGGDTFSGMVAYTRRDFNELSNMGTDDSSDTTRTVANPMDGHSNAVLGRLVWQPGGGHKLRLTGEYTDTSVFTEVLSGRSVPSVNPNAIIIDLLQGTDTGERTRVAADWSWEGEGAIEHAQIGVYWQKAKDHQFTREDRTNAADRTRLNTFDNEVYGASAELRTSFQTGSIQHRLVFGGDISKTRQEGLRDGTVPTAPDYFPSRPFPATDFTLGGLFIADEITIADGALTLFPALRFDAYSLNATDDPLLPPAFVGADQSSSRFSPKMGAVVKLAESVRLFANYATGYKAPEPGQMNQFFENLNHGYTSIPNPNLKPESSESWEGGIRINTGGLSIVGTAFQAEYKDFISREQVGGTGAPGNPMIFQFINLGRVEVKGLEGKLEYRTDAGITGRLSIAYATGDNIDEDGNTTTPLNSIDPIKLVAGMGYRDPDGRFGGELIVTHNASKAVEDTNSTYFLPGSSTVLDATAFVRIADALTLRAGVFNITDQKYTYWSDVYGLAASSQVADAYTRPGRNASVSASFRF